MKKIKKLINKKFYFLCALPRTGATLLSTIINKNTYVKISANSILPDIFLNILFTKKSNTFMNFPYHKGIDNIVMNVFNNYYKDIDSDVIIDKGPWGTPDNLYLLKYLFKNRKFIILIRPVLECLASFIKIEKPLNVEKRCEELMDNNGMIGKNLLSITNIIKEKENHIIINYDDLINNMEEQINKIYSFLNLSNQNVSLNNIQQYSLENTFFDDSVVNADLHTIRVDKIQKINYKVEDYLTTSIIQKYKDIKI